MPVDEAALNEFLSAPDGDAAPAAESAPAAAPAAAPTAPAAEASAEAAIPARETPAADAKVEAAVAATGQTEDKWDPETRKYIESLRSESAKYRQRGQRYNEVFDGYEDEAVDEWLSLASTLREDPRAAATRFQEIAEAIQAQFEAEQAEVAATQADGERPLTRAEVEAILAERDQQADIQRRVAQIEADATTLGYTVGDERYQELLYIASNLPSGDIHEAHAKIAAREQAIIDRYVATLGGKPAPAVPSSNGAPASGERQIKTFAQANEALDAYLAGVEWQ